MPNSAARGGGAGPGRAPGRGPAPPPRAAEFGIFFFSKITPKLQKIDPLPIDLFRLISMRGARIWPQNGGKRPGTRFFVFFRNFLD